MESANRLVMMYSSENMDNEAHKIVISDDFVREKNQKPLIDYFIRGRHKNWLKVKL